MFGASRADLFPLAPVLQALAAAPDLSPTLLASGTTANRDYGDPLAGVDLTGVAVEHLADDLGASDFGAVTAGGGRIGQAMAAALGRLGPDAVVVLGDRWELLYAVPPVVLAGIPLVHLHGGEVTEGAVDDRIRHGVSKLADLHCVSTERAARRLRQLGEPSERIHVTGAPSLDAMDEIVPASDEALVALLGRAVERPFALITYHPPTAGGPEPGEGVGYVLDAVAATVASAVVTHPGLDRGREAVLARIDEAVAAHPHLVAVEALGASYLPVLAAADVVVGNSSSGVLEAASFGVPVVNVGDRQRGRVSGDNVLDAAEDLDAICSSIRRCLDPDFRERAERAVNVYGDGHAAPRIVDVVRRAVAGGLVRKPFVDLRCS